MQHPITLLSSKNKSKYSDSDLIDNAIEYLQGKAADQPCCKSKFNSSFLTCSCLSCFAVEDDGIEYPFTIAVARYMVYFAKLSFSERYRTVMDWIRYSEKHAKTTDPVFWVPVLFDEEDDDFDWENHEYSSLRICKNALLTILGKGRRFWTKCSKAVKSEIIPQHGLVGRTGNQGMSDDQTKGITRLLP